MCKLKSAIVLKNKIFMPDYDSHSQMLEELGIEDNYLNASKTFVRVELSPNNGDVFSNMDTWELTVDQDIKPEWFTENEYKPLIVEKVKEWAKDHIHIGVNGLKINAGENHYIKDCQNVKVYDSATVEYVYGSATVNKVCDSATVKYVCGSATVNKVCDSATVDKVCDSATVNEVCGSATVNEVCGSATVEYVYGSATVNKVCDSATVISSPYWKWYNSSSIVICDNATFKDCYTKTIYQSGDWKLVEVK